MEPIVICVMSRGFSSNQANSGRFDDFCSNVRWETFAKPTG
jgi:hypothetical protein